MENESTLHQCTDCGREFKTASALASHARLAHKEPDRFLPPDHTGTPRSDSVPESEVLGLAQAEGLRSQTLVGLGKNTRTLTVRKLPHYRSLPDITRATAGSAGFDLFAAISQPICIGVNEKHQIPTGLCFEIPEGLFGLVAPRSGLATKHDITLSNSPGIIDSDYRGEVFCCLKNHSSTRFWVQPGMRVAQIVFTNFAAPDIIYSSQLTITSRGTGGFGSTGGI